MIAVWDRVTYTYPGSNAPALEEIACAVHHGELLLLVGPSGGGKSTFLRTLNGLVPQFHGGILQGRIRVCGLDPVRTPTRTMATRVGMVFQEPEAQAIADTVEEEIAFGLELHAVPSAEILRRVATAVETLGIAHLRQRRLSTLSGGERQRVALAAVLALEPQVLALDEPTSQLDPEGAEHFVDAVLDLHRRLGLTVFIAEHRRDRIQPIASRVLLLDRGRIQAYAPRDAGRLPGAPAVPRLGLRLGLEPPPLTLEEARAAVVGRRIAVHPPAAAPAPGAELVRAEALSVTYGAVEALAGVSVSLAEGELVALLGKNGAGKTTLLRTIVGLTKPAAGAVRFRGQPAPPDVRERSAFAALLPQNPAYVLSRRTLAEEIRASLEARAMRAGDARAIAARWRLAELLDRHPYDLSVGQQQRAALAVMLAHEPPVWLLDEPTRGADHETKEWLAGILREHAARGGAALVATHDVEFAARWATRAIVLEAGRVTFDGPAREAFGAAGPYPTTVARVVPGALLPEEVVAA